MASSLPKEIPQQHALLADNKKKHKAFFYTLSIAVDYCYLEMKLTVTEMSVEEQMKILIALQEVTTEPSSPDCYS